MTHGARAHWPLAAFALVALTFLWRSTLAGQAFVPAELLRWLAPWSVSHSEQDRPPWNPLMYDSVGQFHPWRKFAGEELRAGRLPLWNPYQLCGTPFVGNSQSAVLYPGNLLYVVLPAWRAAGWTAVLHLLLAAAFTAALLRRLGACRTACAFGGIAYAFSTWQVAWLHLPTFLNTSCWLPLVLLCVLRLYAPGARAIHASALGGAVGMALLAGHLQIAFYVILAAALLAAWLTLSRLRSRERRAALRGAAGVLAALAVGAAIAAPQVLPTLELSRQSHRTGTPTPAGYAAYTRYAVHPGALATLALPDFYGSPSRLEAPYFGFSRGGMLFNYAEGALYVGLPTLLLAGYALVRRRQPGRLVGWFGGLAALALLMALGTAVDALFYYTVPGFASTGSPGRTLVLWAFAASVLGALGLHKLLTDEAAPVRSAAAATVACAALVGVGVGTGWPRVAEVMQAAGGDVWQPQLVRQCALAALATGALFALAAGKLRTGWTRSLPVVLLAVDVVANGATFNPDAAPSEVYPVTETVEALRVAAGNDRIMPLNDGWSFAGPDAVLPPNAATAYRLRDLQGYDSLMLGAYKAYLDRHAGRDSSPPEVGNMVFAREPTPSLLAEAGVRVVVASDDRRAVNGNLSHAGHLPAWTVTGARGRAQMERAVGYVHWRRDLPTRLDLEVTALRAGPLIVADVLYPGWRAAIDGRRAPLAPANGVFRRVDVPRGEHIVTMTFEPASFRIGVYLLLAVAAGIAALLASDRTRRASRSV